MEDFFAIVVAVAVLVLAFIGVFSLGATTPDSSVIKACESHGWYNFGQTRIVCSVEKAKQ